MAKTAEPQPASKKRRRTQEERSATTRAQLLDATIECLVDLGYAATTTTVIAERAGVSRGAQLHHYPTKAELVAAAVEHLSSRLTREFAAKIARSPADANRVSAAIDVLWTAYSTPLFPAWLELSVAARTDADLRAALAPVEQRLLDGIEEEARALFHEDGAAAVQIQQLLAMTQYMVQGMALDRTLSAGRPAPRDRQEAAMLEVWRGMVAKALADADSPSSLVG